MSAKESREWIERRAVLVETVHAYQKKGQRVNWVHVADRVAWGEFTPAPHACRMKYQHLRQLGHTKDAECTEPPVKPEEEYPTATADARAIEFNTTHRIATLEELCEMAEVDTTVWEVERWVANKWEVGAKDANGKLVVEPLYQVKAWLKRIKGADTLKQLREGLLADLKAEARRIRLPAVPKRTRGTHLLEIAPVDLHIGKLSWSPEVGHDYDISMAVTAFESALSDVLEKAKGFPVEQVALVVGNDLLQVDNLESSTTSGTRVDSDSRYVKMFRAGVLAMRRAALRCREVAPTTIVVVPGNHDRMGAFHVGEVLAAQFEHDPRITVDNSPPLRKYLRYGVTLLGFTHGNEEKEKDLPLIMARERAQDWAEAKQHEWHTGHFHKAKETRYVAGDSFAGVRVRILPSLSGTDAWHHVRGYVHERRTVEAYLFHKSAGYVGHFSSTAEDVREAA